MKFKLLFIGLLICTAGFSQDFFMKRKLADNFFNNFDFNKAIPFYEQLARKNPEDMELFGKLAIIYDHLNDSKNAERCYAVLVNAKEVKPMYLLNFALVLSKNGKYSQSLDYFKKYQEVQPNDPRGAAFTEAYRNIGKFFQDTLAFQIQKAPFSSTADDFSPAYFGKNIVFSSDRSGFSLVKSNYNWTQSPYLDLYIASPDSKEAKSFSKDLNSIYHEGPVTFSKNQDTILFTRSNYFRFHLHKSNEGVNKLSLFQAVWNKEENRWVNIHPLSLNSDEYSIEHPALSPDGSELYFASDMPGGLGGMDLYVSHQIIDPNGEKSWGIPVNLGPGINTPGLEVFPYVDDQRNLWFASNGIPGLGGLDIFFAAWTPTGFAKTANPGYPLNTRFDDFGLITKGQGEEGYFSSNRYKGFGEDDIFSFKRPFRNLAIWLYDARIHKGLNHTHTDILTNGLLKSSMDKEAATPGLLKINPYTDYKFIGKKEKYKSNSIVYTKEELQHTDTLKIPLESEGPVFRLDGIAFSAFDKNPVSTAVATITDKSSTVMQTIKIDSSGQFKGDLMPETDYKVSVINSSGKGLCSTARFEISTKGLQKDSTFHLSIPFYCAGDVIALEKIYYDLNKSNIRPDAALVLDKLLKLMNDYPGMSIELRSHTDSRATAEYNLGLSDQRAKAAAAYLVSKGINKERIIGKGYGKTMLINKCADGVPCTEAEHQANRRTDFKILKME